MHGESDTVRKCESEGRSSFDYGIGIRTDIVRNKLWFKEESQERWSGPELLENLASIYEQLYLTPGEAGEKLYPDIVLRGQHAPTRSLDHFHGTKKDNCVDRSTPAGKVRVLTLYDRSDFETFLQIMAEACRKTAIPATQGAVILDGVINHRRIEQHKEAFYRAAQEAGMPEPSWFQWEIEKARFMQDKANYTDALIVLSVGPYSAVPARRAGFEESEWLTLSHTIREYHECTHFVCRRLWPDKKDAIWDEIVADAVGLLAALGKYDMRLAKLALGIEDGRYVGGRLENYVPEQIADKTKYIEGILRKVLAVMEAAQRFSENMADDPFALAFTLEERKDSLWAGTADN